MIRTITTTYFLIPLSLLKKAAQSLPVCALSLLMLITLCQISFAQHPADLMAKIIAEKQANNQQSNQVMQGELASSVNTSSHNSFSIARDNQEKNAQSNPFYPIEQQWVLVVFFSSTCPHCKRFMPVLKRFSVTYHFKVYDYTLDGAGLPSYPDPLFPSQKTIHDYFGNDKIHYPALFMVNKHTLTGIPISLGEMPYVILKNRMLQLKNTIQRYGL
ncbi:conjugal transfer protein TraF [Fangia hongkongensis]|uniref:conjugal transfer protein TraF n=1 Tax=Fangia hongkongensis TaxID=270495 RepID=UPI00037406E8|nr:conjugal transfer protein TraF [Fangia hongkongensis]